MKISIIGANSYIARNLIFYIKQQQAAELFLYDGQPVSYDEAENYTQIDIFSTDSLSLINMDVDVIYMFVGKTGSADGFDNPDVFIDVNERALLYVLNEYRRQVSKALLIFPSTRLLYDNNSNAKEDDVSNNLKTIYAINKLACEHYLKAYRNTFGVRYCIARICIPYGTLVEGASSYGTAEFMLSKATNGQNITLYGDGSIRRTLTYMGDLCDMLLKLSYKNECDGEVYNIGGEDYSLKEMAELIAGKYNVGIEYVEYPDIALKIESGDTVFCQDKLESIISKDETVTFSGWINSI